MRAFRNGHPWLYIDKKVCVQIDMCINIKCLYRYTVCANNSPKHNRRCLIFSCGLIPPPCMCSQTHSLKVCKLFVNVHIVFCVWKSANCLWWMLVYVSTIFSVMNPRPRPRPPISLSFRPHLSCQSNVMPTKAATTPATAGKEIEKSALSKNLKSHAIVNSLKFNRKLTFEKFHLSIHKSIIGAFDLHHSSLEFVLVRVQI